MTKATKFQSVNNMRSEQNARISTGDVGKLYPVLAVPYRESEGGTLQARVVLELAAIAGRIYSDIIGTVRLVYVPALAMDEMQNPTDNTAGIAEIFRDKLIGGSPIFPMEYEAEITKRMGINPASIGGHKKVCRSPRLAYNCAVNLLRRRAYEKTTLLDKDNWNISPSLLSTTALKQLGGVLDPEERVDGAIPFSGEFPVKGIGTRDGTSGGVLASSALIDTARGSVTTRVQEDADRDIRIELNDQNEPQIFAVASTGDISLKDFYTGQRIDKFTREFRAMVDADPVHGEEQVAHAAYALSVETGRTPWVMYEREFSMRQQPMRGSDAAGLDYIHTEVMQEIDITVPVPKTEFGGVVVALVDIRPTEIVSSQPHPIFSQAYTGTNYAEDSLQLEPTRVTVRELDSDCATADEEDLAMFVGYNHLKRRYQTSGLARNEDPNSVENKTALWLYDVPLSTTPENSIYPESIDTYPFSDQTSPQVKMYTEWTANIMTPLQFGPTPVEALAILDGGGILDAPTDEE